VGVFFQERLRENREGSVMSSRLKIKRIIGQFLLFLSALFLVAFGCGGGGGGGDGGTSSQGTFEDSIVEGLKYETATQSGLTDANGIFEYQDGETVTFSIGDIILGEGPAKAWMTPIDLVSGAVDPTDPTVSNICRFLMTLDDDNNPDNGIFINESVREDAKGRSLDFNVSITDFENDPDVQQAVASLTALTSAGQRGICSCGEAQIHLGNLYPWVNPENITVIVGGTGTATITGGKSPYSASSNNPSVATVSVNGNTVAVTGVAEGTVTITITDRNSNTVTLAVVVVGANPVSGDWTGSAGFGDLSFTVDSTGTGITEITWDWIDFTCDGVTKNGSITWTPGTPEPIINGQFTVEYPGTFVSGDPYSEFSMSGTFDASGTHASGTYEAVVFGTSCPGTWNASPVGTTTTIDWVGTPWVEHGGSLTKKFFQNFVVSGPSGNVQVTVTCKNPSGNILDELTKAFPVEGGEEYEITADARVLGLGRSPSPVPDDVFFSSLSASSSTSISIGDCTATYDDVIHEWYYLCATDYEITDINIQLVP